MSHDLIIRLKNGDLNAFDQVYDLYVHRLFYFIFKLLKNEAEADDIVQEVFVKIWESKHQLDDCKQLHSYIFTIAYHSSIDLIRKRINNHKYIEHLKKLSVLEEEMTGSREMEYDELMGQVEKMISNLPERQKQVYLLHREQGLTYPEIADRLSISKNTVENHMVKALQSLRKQMSHALPGSLLFLELFI